MSDYVVIDIIVYERGMWVIVKRKIVNMGTIGIVVIILLVGVLNYKQAAETEMKKIETEENSVRENKTNYTYEQDVLCRSI